MCCKRLDFIIRFSFCSDVKEGFRADFFTFFVSF